MGEDLSPPSDRRAVPEDEVSLGLVVDDLDAPAGTFMQWLAWGIDPQTARVADDEAKAGCQAYTAVGVAAGESPRRAHRCARFLLAYELLFWDALADAL